MSVLTRTKGYFIVICIIMCGFLFTFSWRLLYSATDSNNIVAKPIIRQLMKRRNASVIDLGVTRDKSVTSQPTTLKYLTDSLTKQKHTRQNHTKEIFSDSEIGPIVEQIRELGLSMREVKDKLLIWKQQKLLHLNTSTISPSKTYNKTIKVSSRKNKNKRSNKKRHGGNKDLQKGKVNKHNMKSMNSVDKTFNKPLASTEMTPSSNTLNSEKFTNFSKTKVSPERNINLNTLSNVNYVNVFKEENISIPINVSKEDPSKIEVKNESFYNHLARKYPQFSNRLELLNKENDLLDSEEIRQDYCTACSHFNFPIILNHERLCRSSPGRSKLVDLVIFIASAPSNYHSRTVIRQTWGARCRSKHASSLKCLFVVGLTDSNQLNSQIRVENDYHQDILQIGFKDAYSNLTYKTISILKWADRFCYNAKFVMKTDDDMYVNTDLIPIMLEAAPKKKFMGGACWGTSSPNRDRMSKWFVSYKSFQKSRFPPMCSGTGYIMSMDVVRSVIFSSQNVPFFHLEDVYVSLCLQKYGILPMNILGFSNMFQEFDECQYKNSVMTSHQVPSGLLSEFWSSMNRCPKINVSPSQLYIIMPYPETD